MLAAPYVASTIEQVPAWMFRNLRVTFFVVSTQDKRFPGEKKQTIEFMVVYE